MKKDRRLFFKINKAQKLIYQYADKEIKSRLNITPIQLAVLFYLKKNNGCLLKDLSKELDQNNSAITTLVDRMEKKELLTKKASETDGRAFQVFITPTGMTIAQKGLPFIRELNAKLTTDMSEEDLDVIHNFLDKSLIQFKK